MNKSDTDTLRREDLRDQHAIGEEIATAISGGIDMGVDEDELDEELAELQQEELDNKMLKTGTVPVHDQVQRLPTAATGECKFDFISADMQLFDIVTNSYFAVRGRAPAVEEYDEEEELRKLQAEMAM